MNQQKRFQVYDRFSTTPHGAILFATNIAERGLDFPNVDWVVQADCPHSVEDYIHRVGRTARFNKCGRSILLLLPSELNFVKLLEDREIKVKLQKFPESKINKTVTSRAPTILVRKLELAEAARMAFSAFLRDYSLIARSGQAKSNRMASVFRADQLPIMDYIRSLGLPYVPKLPKEFIQLVPSASELVKFSLDDDDDGDHHHHRSTDRVQKLSDPTELDSRVKELKPLDFVSDSSSEDDDDDEDESDSLLVKTNREWTASSLDDANAAARLTTMSSTGSKKKNLTRIQLAKKMLKRKVPEHRKIEFDEDGQIKKEKIGNLTTAINCANTDAGITECMDVELERQKLKQVTDEQDKKLWRERVRERHRIRRLKLKQARCQIQQASMTRAEQQQEVVLGDTDEDVSDEEMEMETSDN